MTVYFATLRLEKKKSEIKPCVPRYSAKQWLLISALFNFFCTPSSTLATCIGVSGAVCVPGSSAVCTSNYCQALLYPCLAHPTHHQYWVTVLSPDRRDDPDASSHPTRPVTCFWRRTMPCNMPFWAGHVSRPENFGNTLQSQHILWVFQIRPSHEKCNHLLGSQWNQPFEWWQHDAIMVTV